MRKGNRVARLASVTGLVFAFMAGWSTPAGASITEGSCDGSVTIDGTTYTPANDSPDNPIVVPDKKGLVATYEGTTGVVIHNHTGQISVMVGPAGIPVADWGGKNADDEVEASGTYAVDDAFDKLGFRAVGIYRIEGSHAGDEDTCAGFAYVKVEGNPLGTPAGAGAVAVGVAAAAGVIGAGFAKKGAR
jgi:hypothetical protein